MLTIERRKRLTEFLRECWHEASEPTPYGIDIKCIKCRKWVRYTSWRLDFSNWRVVGRLIEKFRSMIIEEEGDFFELTIADQERVGYIESALWANNQTQAICLAIDDYLKERKGSHDHH